MYIERALGLRLKLKWDFLAHLQAYIQSLESFTTSVWLPGRETFIVTNRSRHVMKTVRLLGPRGSPDSETIPAAENGQELKIPTGQMAV